MGRPQGVGSPHFEINVILFTPKCNVIIKIITVDLYSAFL